MEWSPVPHSVSPLSPLVLLALPHVALPLVCPFHSSSSLPTPSSSLSCCAITVIVLFESVVVVEAVVLRSSWFEMGVGGVMMWHMSAT